MKHTILSLAGIALLGASLDAGAIDVNDTRLRVANVIALPAGLNLSMGDMLFSADGSQVYFLDGSEGPGSTVKVASVQRDFRGDVIGFGAATLVFADGEMDTGLAFGPGTDTFVYRVESLGIAQRFANGTIEDRDVVSYNDEFGGLTFVPPGYANAGNIVTASYGEGRLYMHPTTPDGDGSFTINNEVAFADFSASIGTSVIGDIEYVTSGPLVNSMLLAAYGGPNGVELFSFSIDPTSGLPAEGATPTPVVLASNGNGGAWGVATDPVTGNIWVIDYSNGDLAQLALALPPQVVPAGGPAGLLLLGLSLVALGGWRLRRRTA